MKGYMRGKGKNGPTEIAGLVNRKYYCNIPILLILKIFYFLSFPPNYSDIDDDLWYNST